jgi:hypothetical protein
MDVARFSPEMFPMLAPGVLHNLYFIHLFLVGCDDVDTYRQTTRPKIQEWMNVVMSRRGQEWIICHVVSEPKAKTGLFQLSSTSVFDKLKTDFNQQRRLND